MSMSITIYPPSISIHAPRTGSDDERGGIAGEVDFNPRSPHGERLGVTTTQEMLESISIHAPRTGSDPCTKGGGADPAHFNPRSPHGERLKPLSIPDYLI